MLGSIAGILTTSALLPQLVKVYRTKDVGDLSLWMWLIQSIGVGLWLLHGIAIADMAVIVANSVTLIFNVSILTAVLLFGRKQRAKAQLDADLSY